MKAPIPTTARLSLCVSVVFGLLMSSLSGCKPPPPAVQPAAGASAPTAAGNSPQPATGGVATAATTGDALPAKVVENLEQLIKLTAEYNSRAEKITDRQTYLDQSSSLAELENELSPYVEFMESAEATLTVAQKAALDREYVSRAKPLIDAKRQQKMRLLALVQ